MRAVYETPRPETSAPPRILIAFYTYSGSTGKLAEELQRLTGGTLTRLYPSQPYPSRFPELLEQVRREIHSHHYPRLLPVSESPAGYDIIFVGTPNWCGSIAPPLAAWLRRNRTALTGKVLLPFYSHCGGEPGDVGGAVQWLCPDAAVRPAFAAPLDEQEWPAALSAWLERCGLMASSWPEQSGEEKPAG